MNNSRNIKIWFIALALVLIPVKGYCGWLIPGKYYAELTATVSTYSSGKGTVYVAGEDEDQTYGTSSTNYSNTNTQGSRGGSVEITAYAKANDGYSFAGWSSEDLTQRFPFTYLSTNRTYAHYYTVSDEKSTSDDPKAKPYTIYAYFAPISYTISYAAGDHSTGGSTTATTYDIENSFALKSNSFTPETGWVFDKWKVTTAGSGANGNWTLDSTYEEGESIAAGKFGNVTMTAQWKKNPKADITITVTGLEEGESAIFTVTKVEPETHLYTISVTGDSSGTSSVTIKSLETGFQYQVRPINAWTWTYDMDPNGGMVIGLGASGATFEFEATKKSSVKKNDEKSNTNWR